MLCFVLFCLFFVFFPHYSIQDLNNLDQILDPPNPVSAPRPFHLFKFMKVVQCFMIQFAKVGVGLSEPKLWGRLENLDQNPEPNAWSGQHKTISSLHGWSSHPVIFNLINVWVLYNFCGQVVPQETMDQTISWCRYIYSSSRKAGRRFQPRTPGPMAANWAVLVLFVCQK